jgi:hypothetical protein
MEEHSKQPPPLPPVPEGYIDRMREQLMSTGRGRRAKRIFDEHGEEIVQQQLDDNGDDDQRMCIIYILCAHFIVQLGDEDWVDPTYEQEIARLLGEALRANAEAEDSDDDDEIIDLTVPQDDTEYVMDVDEPDTSAAQSTCVCRGM